MLVCLAKVPPTITLQPASVAVVFDATARLHVSVSGTGPIAYQWRKNGVPIDGAVSPCYTIERVEAEDAGNYLVVVFNDEGIALSDTAVLTVLPYPTAYPHALAAAWLAKHGQRRIVLAEAFLPTCIAAIGVPAKDAIVRSNAEKFPRTAIQLAFDLADWFLYYADGRMWPRRTLLQQTLIPSEPL